MKKHFPFDFFYTLITLLLSFTLVHATYTIVIRPGAEGSVSMRGTRWQALNVGEVELLDKQRCVVKKVDGLRLAVSARS